MLGMLLRKNTQRRTNEKNMNPKHKLGEKVVYHNQLCKEPYYSKNEGKILNIKKCGKGYYYTIIWENVPKEAINYFDDEDRMIKGAVVHVIWEGYLLKKNELLLKKIGGDL